VSHLPGRSRPGRPDISPISGRQPTRRRG